MDIKWGCPECGCTDIQQNVTMSTKRGVRFSTRADGGWEVEDGDPYLENMDVDEEGDYVCDACGAEFGRPARVARAQGFRLKMGLRIDATQLVQREKGGPFIERDVGDLEFRKDLVVVCDTEEEARRVFDAWKAFVVALSSTPVGLK